jgi:hypothetical protein
VATDGAAGAERRHELPLKRLGWFVAIYAASVAAVGLVALPVREPLRGRGTIDGNISFLKIRAKNSYLEPVGAKEKK